MTTPQRIQRKRTRGWRMPPNTVYVGRPSKWGNPWSLYDEEIQDYPFNSRRLIIVRYFADWLMGRAFVGAANLSERRARIVRDLHELRGKNLACWCPLCPDHADGKPLDIECKNCAPCHADVLLKLANEGGK